MNERLTRHIDKFPCRIKNGCPAESWIEKITSTSSYNWDEFMCENCPFEKYINKLAEYEDKEERMEDDLK